MIDFLSECNINNSTIDKMKERYPTELFDLNCNKKEITKIIEYLRSIGINEIDKLLLDETPLFFKSMDYIEKKFCMYNIPMLFQRINDNCEEIEIIL